MAAGDAIVVDVRPAAEYAAGHIPGALSIPLDEMDDRLDVLPDTVEVVAYCRGVYCTFSHDAVRLLAAKGRKAVRALAATGPWFVVGVTEYRVEGRVVRTRLFPTLAVGGRGLVEAGV